MGPSGVSVWNDCVCMRASVGRTKFLRGSQLTGPTSLPPRGRVRLALRTHRRQAGRGRAVGAAMGGGREPPRAVERTGMRWRAIMVLSLTGALLLADACGGGKGDEKAD